MWKGNSEGENGLAQLMSDGLYTQNDSTEASIGMMRTPIVLDGVHIVTTWQIRLNRPCALCSGDAAVMLPHAKLRWPPIINIVTIMVITKIIIKYYLFMLQDV